MSNPDITIGQHALGLRVPTVLMGLTLLSIGVLAVGLLVNLSAPAPVQVEIAGYATSLDGRTGSQRINAEKAAEALNGKIIGPGSIFSFNKVVKSWSFDQGYLKAPVSFDGELVRAYGGGVCQTSTTLYNAALLANLPIVERHNHVFTPHYAAPGRDAAVAQQTVDLRFRNPYPWPIRIRATVTEKRLDIRLFGAAKPNTSVDIETHVLDTVTPQRLTRVVYRPVSVSGRAYLRNPGAEGCRVVTYRVTMQGSRELKRERLSDDTYETMNRIIQVAEPGTAIQ